MTAPARRHALRLAAAALAGIALAGCASAAAAPAPGVAIELAPGVWVVPGTGGAADETNRGRIGNTGFVAGAHGVVAIDTGTSAAHGRALLATIAAATQQPVRLALVTHTRPEFLFGGSAFRERGIPLRMHERTARLMAARCETCLKNLKLQVGEAEMAGTAVYQADERFDATHVLAATGRPLRVLHLGHSSGPGDIAVLDETSGTLFAGGLVDHRRIPDIQDADLPRWHAALAELRALRPRRVVPGHGAPGGAELIEATEAYLTRLETRVRQLVASGGSLLEVGEAAHLPEYADWDQYDTIHRRNASIAFLRFERELLFK